MKTLSELYKEVMCSDDLKKGFAEAAKAGKVDDFLKENGCEATAEEAEEFLEGKGEDRPLSEDDLAAVAGGTPKRTRHTDGCTKGLCGCD